MTIEVASEVEDALAGGRGVVALESTLICHGIPRPQNLELAREIEREVRAAGGVPATIAVLDGRVKVGLTDAELERLAAAPDAVKCSTRDLPAAVATGRLGGTTIAATIFVAAQWGIPVMATGGLGGVHLGGEASMDVSADLEELAHVPIAVVCSGVKSILDPGRTLERLETLGVPVIGYGCALMPEFYTGEGRFPVARIEDVAALQRLMAAHRGLRLPGGVLITQPPPEALALPKDAVDRLVRDARVAAEQASIKGPAQTPFMLAHMAEQSAGATVRLNCALVCANARLAGQLAAALVGKKPTMSEKA